MASPLAITQETSSRQYTYPQGTITLALPSDIAAIKLLIHRAYSPYITRLNGKHPAPMTADLSSLISCSQLFVLRLPDSSDDEIVGCISLSLSAASAEMLEINNLAVGVGMQGRGLGKLLLGFAVERAREKGCREVGLYTNVMMVENLRLYTKLGYREVSRYSEDGFERVGFRMIV
jgi:ribosomal protein S18 acetylase RimI-like enzyme